MTETKDKNNASQRSLGDLSNILFDQLDRLNDPELKGDAMEAEIARSKAVTDVAGQVISNANTVIRGWEFRHAITEGDGGSSDMPKMLEA